MIIDDNSEWSVQCIAERWRFYKVFSDCIDKEIDTSYGLKRYASYVNSCIKNNKLKLTVVLGGVRPYQNQYRTKTIDTFYVLGKDLKYFEKEYFNYPESKNKIIIEDYDQPALSVTHKKLEVDINLDDCICVYDVIKRWEILSPNDEYENYWLSGLWTLVVKGVVRIYDLSYDEYIDYSHLDPNGYPFGFKNMDGFTSEVIKKEDMIRGEIEIGIRSKFIDSNNYKNKSSKENNKKSQAPIAVKSGERTSLEAVVLVMKRLNKSDMELSVDLYGQFKEELIKKYGSKESIPSAEKVRLWINNPKEEDPMLKMGKSRSWLYERMKKCKLLKNNK